MVSGEWAERRAHLRDILRELGGDVGGERRRVEPRGDEGFEVLAEQLALGVEDARRQRAARSPWPHWPSSLLPNDQTPRRVRHTVKREPHATCTAGGSASRTWQTCSSTQSLPNLNNHIPKRLDNIFHMI